VWNHALDIFYRRIGDVPVQMVFCMTGWNGMSDGSRRTRVSVARVKVWCRVGHDAKNARVCPGAFIAIIWGGMWVQRSAVRTRRRDAGVHGLNRIIVRLRHATLPRTARPPKKFRDHGRPFAVSLPKEERTADAEPAMASLIDRRNTPLEQRPPRVPQCT
jgi:hypothetical protein